MIHGDMGYGMVMGRCYGISENVPPRDRQPLEEHESHKQTYSKSDLLWPAKIGMYPQKSIRI